MYDIKIELRTILITDTMITIAKNNSSMMIIHRIVRLDSTVGQEHFEVDSTSSLNSNVCPAEHTAQLYTSYPIWDNTEKGTCTHRNRDLVVDDNDLVVMYTPGHFRATRHLHEPTTYRHSIKSPSPDHSIRSDSMRTPPIHPTPDHSIRLPSQEIQDLLPLTSQGGPSI